MASLLQRIFPGCCSSSDTSDPRVELSLEVARSLAVQVASLEEKLETLALEVDELQLRYSTAPTTPSRQRSPCRKTLTKAEENYLPALLELLENSRGNSSSMLG